MNLARFLLDTSALVRLFRGSDSAGRLVAAAAELHGLTLRHYLDQIATVTGQPVAWLAAPGSID